MRKLTRILASSILALSAAGANAASIDLLYTGPNDIADDGIIIAATGDLLTFDIVMDFQDTPTLGGGFNLSFSSSVLQFEEFQAVDYGDPAFYRGPDVSDGLLSDIAFGSFNGLSGPAVVGAVSFTLLNGAITTLQLGPTMGVGGPFVSADDNITLLDVDFGRTMINMPLPAAAWFFLSAIGALGALRRRQAHSA